MFDFWTCPDCMAMVPNDGTCHGYWWHGGTIRRETRHARTTMTSETKGSCDCVFRDARCRYDGPEQSCDKTPLRCAELGNLANYRGGWPRSASDGDAWEDGTALGALRLRPGDVLVLKLRCAVSQERLVRMKAGLAAALGKAYPATIAPIIVLDAGVDLTVVRRDEEAP